MSPGSKGGGLTGGVWLGQINFVPTDKVVRAWKELTVFLQEFIENNFGKPGLRRVIRECVASFLLCFSHNMNDSPFTSNRLISGPHTTRSCSMRAPT